MIKCLPLIALLCSSAIAGESTTWRDILPHKPEVTSAPQGPRYPRLLFCYAKWCGACKPVLDNLRPWLEAAGWSVGVTERDHLQLVDVDERPDLAVGVSQLPMLVLLRPDGSKKFMSANRQEILAEFSEQKAAGDAAAPTPYDEILRVLDLLPKPQVGFVDFGCGENARWCVCAAEKWGCKVTGVEINPARAAAARERVKAAGLEHLITILDGDATTTEVQADVFAVYLYPDVLAKLQPKLSRMTAGASYMHAVPNMPATKNGDTFIYARQSVPQQSQRMAVWGGQLYSGPVCSDPRCGMCSSIRAQIYGR